MTKNMNLSPVSRLFFTNGLKSVTMDMVAKELGVSKKTLYKHFKNKEDLVSYIFMNSNKKIRNKFDAFIANNNDAYIILLKLNKLVTNSNRIERQTRNLMELKECYPQIHCHCVEDIKKLLFHCIKTTITIGKEQGVIEEYVNIENITDLIANNYLQSRHLNNPFHPEGTFERCASSFYHAIIRGSLTQKGLEYMNDNYCTAKIRIGHQVNSRYTK